MNHLAPNIPASRMLDRTVVAHLIGVTPKTLRAWERLGRGPEVIRFSPKVARYPASSLAKFLGRPLVEVAL